MSKRLLAVLVPAVLASCAVSRDVDAVSTAQVACTSCHGDPTRPGAPPIQAAPPTSPSGGSGGAHLAHLQRGVACGTCHVVPTSPTHSNGVVEVRFEGLAAAKGATPTFSGGPSGTCSGVYCHGATLNAGGSTPTPSWSGGHLACGACHGYPPPATHAAGATSCNACHPGTVNADGTINVAGGLHGNGQIEANGAHASGWVDPAQHGATAKRGLAGCRSCHGANLDGAGAVGPSCESCHQRAGYAGWQSNCTFCHGTKLTTYAAASLPKAAPPKGTQGETATTTRAVGAHQKHLTGGALGPAVACAECHVVPADLGHLENGGAAVTFGPAATRGGARPSWNGTSCAATACHGGLLAGGSNTTPAWTAGASQTTCGTCHGIPPPAPHTTSTSCGTCHSGYTASAVNATLHMNGAIDATSQHPAGWAAKNQHGYAANRQGLSSCTGCHGADFAGGTTGVSCNACHGSAGWTAWQTNCTFCHGTAVKAYTSASLTSAAPPVGSEGETATTARAVGAHQRHLAGGALGPAVACATCHAVPTSLAHLDGVALVSFGAPARVGGATPTWNGASCAATSCHGGTLGGGTNTSPAWTGGASQTTCGSCHGIPPPAPHATSTSCGTCHTGYSATAVNAALHMNGAIDATSQHPAGWAAKDQHGYAANRQGLSSCTGCHGADFAGGTTGVSCNACHASAGWAAWQTNCTFCHGTRVTAYTSASLTSAAPPAGSEGETATTARAVGAHQKHLAGGALGPAVACATCHAVPANLAHVNGTASVVMTGPAARDGVTPSWNGATCATYCHGASLPGGSVAAPSWTAGASQTTCGACHGVPPPAPHTTSTSCGSCHTGYTATAVNAALHMNGTVDATSQHPAGWSAKEQHGYSVNRSGLSSCKSCHGASLDGVGGTGPSCTTCHASAGFASWATSCTFCHGNRTSGLASPPVDTQGGTAATNVSVGNHASHMGTTLMAAPTCTACHPNRTGSNVVTDAAHVDGNGIAEVAFSGIATSGGARAVYTRTSATAASCAATYCHGGFTGGANATMSWTSTTQVSCTSCHGLPPTSGKHGDHSSRSCGDCHPGYTRTSVNQATHVDGARQVGNRITSWNATTRQCVGCHGSETW